MTTAVGLFFMTWATLEMGLDLCATVIFHSFGGKDIDSPPRALSRKVKFIRKCVKRFDTLSDHRAQFLDLLRRVDALTNFRHQITHGVWNATEDDPNALIFVRLVYDDAGFHTGDIQTFTAEVLRANEIETKAIAHGLLGLGLTLARAAASPGHYDDIDKTLSKI
jgi:hypothetical protein